MPGNHVLERDFRAHFGVNAHVCQKIWALCQDNFFAKNILPKHLLWGLLFLNTYATEPILATMAGVTRKSFRLWAWQVVSIIAAKKRHVVSTTPKHHFSALDTLLNLSCVCTPSSRFVGRTDFVQTGGKHAKLLLTASISQFWSPPRLTLSGLVTNFGDLEFGMK